MNAKPLDELLDRDSRVVFVRRVYGLLTANLALTAISCLYCSTHHNVIRNILLGPSGPLLMGLCVATGLGASLAVSFSTKLRSSIPLFTLFACAESVLVGVAASAFKARKRPPRPRADGHGDGSINSVDPCNQIRSTT